MRQVHIYSTLLCACALLTACEGSPSAEEPATGSQSAGRIEILGGAPGSLPLSRASEPSRLGYCNADRLRIWIFNTGATMTTVAPSTTDHKLTTSAEANIINYCGDYNTDRWTAYTYQFEIPAARRIGFALPALAYSEEDEDLFTTNAADTEITFSTHTLSLTSSVTPELFFGNLTFEGATAQTGGALYVQNNALTPAKETKALEGKIYRLVSQLNLEISEVNPLLVKQMDLLLSNVPKAVKLHGTHGSYYPVEATGDVMDGGEEYITVASATDFRDDRATLSTYLLPSLEGRKIKVRITYAPEAFHTTGETVRDYEITPDRSAYLSGENAKVYGSDSPIYVYNSVLDLYYSYANVRVNLKGKFENFFSETAHTDVTLEVCPTFETSHNIPIIE